MRITAVTPYPVRLGHRNVFVLTVETDAGITGVGEGGISGRELAMAGMTQHFERMLLGMDPRRIEHIWQLLYRSAYFEGGKISGAVISAIDIACWDILGQSLGVPVWQLLGGNTRDWVGCFATGGALTGPDCVERARALVDAGWRHLRFGPGMPGDDWLGVDGDLFEPLESLELAAHWLRELRSAFGPGIALSIDLHHRFSVAEAAMFCQRVADLGLHFVEEPIRAQSPQAYAQLRAMTPLPLAVGEEFASKWEFLPFVEGGLLDYARIDVCNVGGLSEARKVAGWCEAHYIDVLPHNPIGPVCTAASIHLAASITNAAQLEYWPNIEAATTRDLFPVFPTIEGQRFPLPTAPGLGVTFNAEAAADHPFEPWEPPHWHRRDGSYTNW